MSDPVPQARAPWFPHARYALATIAGLAAFITWSYLTRDAIQGKWQGVDAPYSANFAGNSLVLRGLDRKDPITPPEQSWFKVDEREGYLEIQREGSVQLGRYSVEGDTLILKLAEMGKPCPGDVLPHPDVRNERRYVFHRAR
ncbi:MAG TPA: hypothetical protein VFW87_14450 [Pirellulales bacterium]|nr:hypothetical protein [Pirellulales bacterium]